MELIYEVKRERYSVTQGTVDVYLNGEFLISFSDTIELGGTYGEVIGGWGSTVSDERFIKGVLFPFYTNQELVENRMKEILQLND